MNKLGINQYKDMKWRVPEMKKLRLEEHWTLQEIADKYRISRERVRQILGNTGRKYNRRAEFVKNNPILSNKAIQKVTGFCFAQITKYRGKERHAIDGGGLEVGTKMEEYISSILLENGIENTLMGHFDSFDILLKNGLRIDVKSANPLNNARTTSPIYSFRTSRTKRDDYTDFFICITIDTKDVFVIPANETRRNSPVRFCWPEGKRRKSKWHKFHDRFDLLKP